MIVKRIATNSPSAPARVAKRRDGHASRRTIATYAMTSIVGKTILVTGASQGIGLEFVRQFAQKGNNVIATVRTRTEDLDRLGLSAQVHILELDVSSPESIQACTSALKDALQGGHIDYVVNNAGVYGQRKSFRDVTQEDMHHCFQVNTIGPLLVTQHLLNASLIGPPGSVVANVTSKVGSVDDNRSGGGYAYRASKSALNIVNKSMAIDLAPEGITCVLLHPGYVRTRMTGGNGLIDTSTSVAGMISVLESDKPLNGCWYDYAGKEIPW